MSNEIVITRAEWKKIHRDFKGTTTDGQKYVFAACLPQGRTTETGTTIVAVRVEG